MVFSLTNVSKMNVLSTLRFKTLINIFLFWIFWSKSGTFSENPYAKTQKTQKKYKKTLALLWKIVKKSNFVLKTNAFLQKWPGTLGTPGFSWIFDFAVCGVFCVGLLMIGVYFLISFLHFLQKYRCVPKIGFSADIFPSTSFIFFRRIIVYLKIGFSTDIPIDIFLLTFLLKFVLTFLLTFLLTRRGKEEGVDFSLKSDDPTPEGGEICSLIR